MTRKKDNIISIMIEFPWWVSIIVSGAIYILLRYFVPTVQADHYLLTPLAEMLTENAIYFALFFSVPAPISLLRELNKNSLVERQQDIYTLKRTSWSDFEKMICEVYRRQGYAVQLRGGSGGDGGVDVVLKRKNEVTLVQCKQWKSKSVGVSVVRELLGSMKSEQAERGIIVTTGNFSKGAIGLATRNNGYPDFCVETPL